MPLPSTLLQQRASDHGRDVCAGHIESHHPETPEGDLIAYLRQMGRESIHLIKFDDLSNKDGGIYQELQ